MGGWSQAEHRHGCAGHGLVGLWHLGAPVTGSDGQRFWLGSISNIRTYEWICVKVLQMVDVWWCLKHHHQAIMRPTQSLWGWDAPSLTKTRSAILNWSQLVLVLESRSVSLELLHQPWSCWTCPDAPSKSQTGPAWTTSHCPAGYQITGIANRSGYVDRAQPSRNCNHLT